MAPSDYLINAVFLLDDPPQAVLVRHPYCRDLSGRSSRGPL